MYVPMLVNSDFDFCHVEFINSLTSLKLTKMLVHCITTFTKMEKVVFFNPNNAAVRISSHCFNWEQFSIRWGDGLVPIDNTLHYCMIHRWLNGLVKIPQCTSPISHNAPFCNRNVHVCTFLFQNGALWDNWLMHCGICEVGVFWGYHVTYLGHNELFCLQGAKPFPERMLTCLLHPWKQILGNFNTSIFIQEKTFENGAYKMLTILFRPPYVKFRYILNNA